MHDDREVAAVGIIADVLGCQTQGVTADARIGSLPQWDSIAHVSIILAFEERLGRQLTGEEVASLETVASFVALLAPRETGAAAT